MWVKNGIGILMCTLKNVFIIKCNGTSLYVTNIFKKVTLQVNLFYLCILQSQFDLTNRNCNIY